MLENPATKATAPTDIAHRRSWTQRRQRPPAVAITAKNASCEAMNEHTPTVRSPDGFKEQSVKRGQHAEGYSSLVKDTTLRQRRGANIAASQKIIGRCDPT